ncbi:MAG: hypothetical protein LQ339_001692 [Xanthoria mediterranea]|nr:MAG: hypothetical protein LQ339_001692 [Xanthoria mediterranea]
MPHQHHAKHQHIAARAMQLDPRQQETVVQVIYKTAEKTFDGPIGGYKTLDGSEDSGNNAFVAAPSPETQAPSPIEQSTQAPQAPAQVQSTPIAESPTTPTPTVQTPAAAPQQEEPTTQIPVVAPVATSSKSNPKPATPGSSSSAAKSSPATKNSNPDSNSVVSQVSSQITGATPTQDSSASSSSSIAQNAAGTSASTPAAGASDKSDGMSGGAKAGLAIGLLLAIGLFLALIFVCYRRKKKQQNKAYQVADDEKSVPRDASGAVALGRAASTRTTAAAPRLSLRPVTQFLPDLAGRRKSGNTLATAGGRSLAPTDNRRPQQNQSSNPTNPFGDHAEPSEKAMAPRQERSVVPNQANNPSNPFGNHAETVERPANVNSSMPNDAPIPAPLRIRTPTPEGQARAVGSVGAAGAALAAAGVTGRKNDAPKPLNLSPKRSASPAPMPSPSGTEFSMNSVTPAAMASGPPPSNVHRVQLDFKPSMEDEMALRAGQLVRLLHEYDDGWTLCIRLDRSQQGVAPRTCLSARPVKPRPNPNARGPPPRGLPPPGMFNPGQQRPMSPSSGRGSPSPYDRTPRGMAPGPAGGQCSMSPGPYGGGPQRPHIPPPGGRRRSNSASEVRERRMSPPGPSPMNPNAQGILSGAQKVPSPQQAVVGPDQVPLSSSPPASIPARKPVPGQAI